MPTQLDIFNRAIEEAGGKPILDVDEDTPNARRCRRAWPMVREEVLQEFAWNSVTTRIVLNPLETAPAFGYSRAYAKPPECLRVVSVNDFELEDERWIVEGDSILTDLGPTISVRYTRDETTDFSKFAGLLGSALALRLALAISARRGLSATDRREIADAYDAILTKAKLGDTREQSTVDLDLPQSIAARHV